MKHKGKIIAASILISTILGTYSGNEGGFPPAANIKTGTSFGINVGLYTQFMPSAKHYGISLSIVSNQVGGTINGINAGIFNFSEGEAKKSLNGLEVGVLNMYKWQKNNKLKNINGAQISLINNGKGNCVQIGIFNQIQKSNNKYNNSFLINYHFKGKSRDGL
jgi:hypothetical protein